MGLLRVPAPYVITKGGLMPTGYEVTIGGKLLKVAPEAMVHFRGYNAESAILGLSPLETLRRVLAEEHAAGDYRESFWANAARMGGIIERPADSPAWSQTARIPGDDGLPPRRTTAMATSSLSRPSHQTRAAA